MKNKNRLILAACIIFLIIGAALFAILNTGDIKEKKQSQEEAEVKITLNGEEAAVFTLFELMKYKKIVFTANLDENGEDSLKKTFGGVPLKDVFADLDITINEDESIIFSAADGYQTAAAGWEVLQEDNIYLVYERDGRQTGTKADGGTGPIEIVIAKDDFSQRWCKFLMEIKIDEST